MRKLFYYYKKPNGDFVFQDGRIFTDDREAVDYIAEKRGEGLLTWRLYLDIPIDRKKIEKMFNYKY